MTPKAENRSCVFASILRSAGALKSALIVGGLCAMATNGAQAADVARLQELLANAAPGSWIQANSTTFGSAFATGLEAVPDGGLGNPGSIVKAWSSFAWDSNRGELLLFGGGHYNYLGNEMYAWNAATGAWNRGSLPSLVTGPDYMIADNSAPQSAHTYDNNVFLPVNDRFLTFGGATHPYGGTFRALINGVVARTGPWVWNPALANPNLVGGTSGSGFNLATAGGNMWGDRLPLVTGPTLASAINGTTAYRTENGQDIIYVTADANQSGLPNLYRYTVGDIALGQADTIDWIGRTVNGGVAHEGAGTLDTTRNLYVRTTGHPEYNTDLIVWRLTGASSSNVATDFDVDLVNSDGSAFSLSLATGLDYDPLLDQYFAWDGVNAGRVYSFKAEVDAHGNLLSTWHVVALESASALQPNGSFVTGVFGKWKFIDQLGAYVALDEYDGVTNDAGVWLYKPLAIAAAVPETSTSALLLFGLIVVVCARRSAAARSH